jgi:hypothetical protein
MNGTKVLVPTFRNLVAAYMHKKTAASYPCDKVSCAEYKYKKPNVSTFFFRPFYLGWWVSWLVDFSFLKYL